MSAPGGPPARTGRILAAYAAADIPRTRPPKPVPIDDALLDAWADCEAANQRARDAYYGTTTYYEARNAAVAKTQRYRARKAAS